MSVSVSVCLFDFLVLSFVCAALTQWGDLPEVTDVRGLWCVCMLMMFLTLYSPSGSLNKMVRFMESVIKIHNKRLNYENVLFTLERIMCIVHTELPF